MAAGLSSDSAPHRPSTSVVMQHGYCISRLAGLCDTHGSLANQQLLLHSSSPLVLTGCLDFIAILVVGLRDCTCTLTEAEQKHRHWHSPKLDHKRGQRHKGRGKAGRHRDGKDEDSLQSVLPRYPCKSPDGLPLWEVIAVPFVLPHPNLHHMTSEMLGCCGSFCPAWIS